MQRLNKILISSILIISIIAAFCPVFTFASVGTQVSVNEETGAVYISGNVENYNSKIGQAYIVVPANGKTYADFASADTTEELRVAVKYIGYANVASNGSYTKIFNVPGIRETDAIYVSYSGTVVNVNEANTKELTKLVLEGTVTYEEGEEALDIVILHPGYTLDDYIDNDCQGAFIAEEIISVPVDKDGSYKYEISDASHILPSSKVIELYAGNFEQRDISLSERVLTLYVDPVNGDDDNSGLDVSKAFETIAAAEAAYSEKKSNGCSCEIILCEGTYNKIPATVSPTAPARLTYTGLNGAVIKNTTDIPLSDFEPVKDSSVLDRLDVNARGYVYQVNLGDYGITKSKFMSSRGTTLSMAMDALMTAVYLDGKPQTIAKWPNSGYYATTITQGGVAYNTKPSDNSGVNRYYASFTNSDVSDWQESPYMYLEGFFNEESDWRRVYTTEALPNYSITVSGTKYPTPLPGIIINESTLTFVEPSYGGIHRMGDSGTNAETFDNKEVYFTVNNFLEAIDVPGEWFVDTDTMVMYYYIPETAEDSVLELTVSANSLVDADSLSNVTFRNLTFKGSRSTTGVVNIDVANDVHFEKCVFEQSHKGIYIGKGRNIVVENNIFNYILTNAIHIPEGADMTGDTLVESANTIANNYFYHCATTGTHGANSLEIVIRTVSSGSDITLMGDVIENNVVHGSPYAEAVMYEGLDTQIRYNEFYNLSRYVGDAGVVYSGARLNMAGNKLEYNYIHDFDNILKPATSSSGVGIYWDDLMSGQTAENNIFVNKGSATTRAIQNHGKNSVIKNNIVYGTSLGAITSARTVSSFPGSNDNYVAAHKSLNDTNLTAAMIARYPQLGALRTELYNTNVKFVADGNVSTGNVHIAVSRPESGKAVQYTTRSLNSLIEPGQTTNKVETDFAPGSGWYDQYKYKQDYYTYVKMSTTLGVDEVFTDMDNHDYTLSNDFTSISAFSGSIDANFKLKEGFDMDSIGLVGKFWDDAEYDKSFSLTYPVNRQIEARDGTATLSWTKALTADRYEYAVYDNAEMTNLVASGEVNAYENCAEVSGLNNGKKYYWTVTAVNDSNEMGASWSAQTGSFTVGYEEYKIENIRFYDADNNEILSMDNFAEASYMVYDFVNRTDSKAEYDIIVTLYNSNGDVLKKMLTYTKNQSVNPGRIECRVELEKPEAYTNGDLVYVFAWENGGGITPIAKKTIIK